MPELLERTSLECTTLPLVIDGEITDHLYAPDLLEETPLPAPESPATLAIAEMVDVGFTPNPSERPTPRSRIFRHVGRIAAVAAAGLGFAFGTSTVDAAPAEASSDKVYTTTDNVYLHADPGLGDKGDLIKIMPKGTKFTADCYVNDTPIGEKNNPAWLHGTDESGATGYFTDYYSDSHWSRNNTLHDQGLAFCGEEKTNEEKSESKPPADMITSVSYDREAAVQWADEHYDDVPPQNASCTWFVSNALWAGGLPRDAGRWTDEGETKYKIQTRQGTKAAWSVQHFLNYMNDRYPQSRFLRLDGDDFRNNSVPDADPGDVIIYDWEDDGDYDHATIVTRIAPGQYPEVAEWSVYDGRKPTDYPRRGWTYSKKNEAWLQVGYPRVVAYLLDIDTTQVGRF